MARGPDGTRLAAELDGEASLDESELSFTHGLERIIDRALERHPPGDRFVYGIHQGLSPATIEVVARRYREAGWGQAVIREGATGAFLLILHP